MGLDDELVEGQTPLDEGETDGLLIPTVTTRRELAEFEQQNIERAIKWAMGRRFKKDDILTEDFVKLVHGKCMAMCGRGPGNSARPIKTSVWTDTRLPRNSGS